MNKTLIIKYPTGELWKEIPDPVNGACQNGEAKEYHRNGTLKTISSFLGGMPHGKGSQWDEKGKLLGEYVINMGNGTVCSWHENGKKQVEMPISENLQEGKTTVWDESGKVILEAYFIRGLKVSKMKYLQNKM